MFSPLRHTPLLPGTLQNLFYPPLKEQYTYFKRAGEVQFANAGTVAKAAWAADAAMLSYARYGTDSIREEDLSSIFKAGGLKHTKIGDWNARGTQGYFAESDDFAILAFRGTEADDPSDLTTDMYAFLSFEQDYCAASRKTEPGSGPLHFFSHLLSPKCLVHRGFQVALETVWKQVDELVSTYAKSYPNKEICFTGHSLGGALALLAFSRFSYPNISLYTFGCPRVGDGAFRDRTLLNPGRGIYRFVNCDDFVTHVPTDSLLYRQTPTESYRFSANGDLDKGDDSFRGDATSILEVVTSLPSLVDLKSAKLDLIPAPLALVDHSPARYCFRLWDCV